MEYDVFLSHNHADKVWTRGLHDRLVRESYNGRGLRVWMDERVLDPGDPSSPRELYSALDRTRALVVVWSPEAAASKWVRDELAYFVGKFGADRVIVVVLRECEPPPGLESATTIDWRSDEDFERLSAQIMPGTVESADRWRTAKDLGRTWMRSVRAQPDGLDPTPTRENEVLLQALLEHDIDEPAEEGLALGAFAQLGEKLVCMDGARHYGVKMVAGEHLAIALLLHHRYREVLHQYLERDRQARTTTRLGDVRKRARSPDLYGGYAANLIFVCARACSKIAEIDPTRIDLSALSSILARLDGQETLVGPEQAVAMMIGHVLAKLRGTRVGEVMIQALARRGGTASKIAAAGAIVLPEDEVVFFTRELQERAGSVPSPAATKPPSAELVELLLESTCWLSTDMDLQRTIDNARLECQQRFADTAVPLGFAPTYGPTDREITEPIVGAVRRVTIANMESIAETIRPTEIALLTEPRIVDLLLVGAGGYFIEEQDRDSLLCQRLHSRNARFAMVSRPWMDRLQDGDCVAMGPDGGSLLIGR